MKLKICFVFLFVASAAGVWSAEPLKPSQIVDLYTAASSDLNFKSVASHIHPRVLAGYREITGALLEKAVENYGKGRVLAFFQNLKDLKDLEAMGDEDYWAFLMANAQQFDPERPVAKLTPIGEIQDENKNLLLIYPFSRRLATLPEASALASHRVYVFEKYKEQWKLINFEPTAFEASLYWFLQQEESKVAPVK